MLGRQGGRGEEEIRGREAGKQCDVNGGFSSIIFASVLYILKTCFTLCVGVQREKG